ncbi:secondary thiamine-phosphate synthase enzyme YjbQ, partial [Loktanella sp. SALINAS62]|uniref:secondary thiamine-phosphate synthase enzyme YjbQ n=1 Tax=Loktanella sp. SALINAS62 TaxID=2706124 RepID=UPI001B8ABCAE
FAVSRSLHCPSLRWVGLSFQMEEKSRGRSQHTSASLLIQENADPKVRTDLLNYFARLVPPTSDKSMSYLTHTDEGPDDMPAHIKAAMMPVTLSIPVSDGRMALGTWQGIYLFEHRTAPHRRSIVAHFCAS